MPPAFDLFPLRTVQTSLPPSDGLCSFVQLIIVSLNQVRLPATAGFMAQLYIWQYGLSMFTITFWTALAVRMVY